ncbi:GntR family transcriptional regulator [Arenibaculum pallidiluteum]|uniref:GntR family transcriptional regulator n=1 Tax=Arenibaculum pallidiluteum TaxID=2812559 RepID=UPI001A962394|nr:GntR family transcriptional regulator [Arenibaculum pallidiluteum]
MTPSTGTGRRGRKTAGPAPEEAMFRSIVDAIADRRLPPGTRLVEEQLAEAFGVSRARVRRVLLRLAEGRIVSIQRNRGAVVARPSVREAREVFQARRLIEREVVRLLAAGGGRMQPEAADRLRRHLAQEAQAVGSGDRAAAIRLSGRFHLLLAELSGQGVLTGLLETLIRRSSLAIAAHEAPHAPDCDAEEHKRIAQALDAGDAEAAERLMIDHLEEVERRLDLVAGGGEPIDLRRIFGRSLAPDPA